jgi:hypothetical protein
VFTLPNKTPTEKKVVTFPFGTECAAGAILSTSLVAKANEDGNDPGAAALTVGTPQLQGTDLLVLIEAGLEATWYDLLATVADADGEVHQLAARLYVTANAA